MESIYYNESETINIDEIKQVAQGIREGKLELFELLKKEIKY